MGASKTAKLQGQWLDTKIEMLAWIRKTISMMPPGTTAKDCLSMVDAAGKLIKMLGDIAPDEQMKGLESKDLTMASERLRRATKSFKDGTNSIFGGDDDDED